MTMSLATPLVDIIEAEDEDGDAMSPRSVVDDHHFAEPRLHQQQQRWQLKREGQKDTLPTVPRRPNQGSSSIIDSQVLTVSTVDEDGLSIDPSIVHHPLRRRHSMESLASDERESLRRRLREATLREQMRAADACPKQPRRSLEGFPLETDNLARKVDSTPSKPRRSCTFGVGLEPFALLHGGYHDDSDGSPRLPRRRHSIGSLLPSTAGESLTMTSFGRHDRYPSHYYQNYNDNQSTCTTSTCDTKPTDNHTARFETLWHEIVTEDEILDQEQLEEEEDIVIVLPPDSEWMLQNYDAATSVEHIHDPQAEIERLKAVHSYHASNGDPDPALDGIACSAQALLQVPVVCIIVLDEKWVWFKSCQGLGESDIVTVPRRASFTVHGIYRRPECGPLVIPDCTQDFRTRESPFVTGPYGLRFFASLAFQCPDTGAVIGSISLLDTKIRPEGLTEEQKETMQTLADRSIARLHELKQEHNNK